MEESPFLSPTPPTSIHIWLLKLIWGKVPYCHDFKPRLLDSRVNRCFTRKHNNFFFCFRKIHSKISFLFLWIIKGFFPEAASYITLGSNVFLSGLEEIKLQKEVFSLKIQGWSSFGVQEMGQLVPPKKYYCICSNYMNYFRLLPPGSTFNKFLRSIKSQILQYIEPLILPTWREV